MKYPTVTAYCDAMRSVKNTFRTLSGVTVICDDAGDPIYRASTRSVRFAVTIDGTARSLRMFTGRIELSINKSCELLQGEIFVSTDSGSDYYDVIVEDPFSTTPTDERSTKEIYENRARYYHNNHWGFTDAAGRVVVEPIYDSVDDFAESRAVVCRDTLYGLIDLDGKEIIPPIYDELSYDHSHLCYTDREGLWGVVDRTGRIISDNQWDWVGEYTNGMLLVKLGGKYGFLNEKGEIAIEIKYDDATSFDHNGYSSVALGGRKYQIDKEEFRV